MGAPVTLTVEGAGFRIGGPPMPHRDLLYEAVQDALADARIDRNQLDTAVTISSDLGEGRGLSQQSVLDSIGGVMRPFDLRLANESLWGLAAAAFQLEAATARYALIAGVWRASDLTDGEAGLGEVLASRLNPYYDRPILGKLQGRTRAALAELLDREGEQDLSSPPPATDLAVAVVLGQTENPEGVLLRGVGWHVAPGWDLAAYEKSVKAAVAQAYASSGRPPTFSWIGVPTYPQSIRQVSLRALEISEDATKVNPWLETEPDLSNVMMDGLYRFATSAHTLRESPPGTWAAVQSWQGFGSSAASIAILEKR